MSHLASNSIEIKTNSGRLTAKIFSCVNLNLQFSGFLDVSDNLNLWDRIWCVLNGRYLQYFNYPPSEFYNSAPVGVIDLGTCVELRRPLREECSRKQTLLLKTYFGKSVLLYCSSITEFECWENCLKIVLEAIKDWEK